MLANGVEAAHWADTLRTIIFQKLLASAADPRTTIKNRLLTAWKTAKAAGSDLSALDGLATTISSETQDGKLQRAIAKRHSLAEGG